jgi:RNA polymerase sigma factor (sigma-70 family)
MLPSSVVARSIGPPACKHPEPLTTPNQAGAQPLFVTTRWTLVMRARGEAPEARAALGELCEAYWTPVYRFLRREGRSEDEARETIQEFFTELLSRGNIDHADPEQGRFRSYFLGALKHFLSDRRRREGRQKRGGGALVQSFDAGTDTSPGLQIPDPAAGSPDSYFDHQWALAVMERGLNRLESTFVEAKKKLQFDTLKPWLNGDGTNLSQSEAAAQLGMTAGAVKVAVHRLRQSFRDIIRDEIAQTVHDPGEITEELRYLIEVLSANR